MATKSIKSTSRDELKDLAVSWLALTTAFAVLFLNPLNTEVSPSEALRLFIICFFTVGTGFLLHELAHKAVSQRHGYWAEFRADYQMLVLAVASAFLGFVFAAPGAVYTQDRYGRGISDAVSGRISVAGPLVNIVLFVVFFLVYIASSPGSLLASIGRFGMFINAFLAAFNMVPFGPLDGRKVRRWSPVVWLLVLVVAAVLTVASFVML